MDNMIERAAWTFVQAFLSVFVVSELGSWESAAIAGAAATLSVVKTFARDQLS